MGATDRGARYVVAPLAGAWIEIDIYWNENPYFKSLPLRERGLKSEGAPEQMEFDTSLPLRERGLKLVLPTGCGKTIVVAPLAGAWIEMPCTFPAYKATSVAPLAGAWIEIWTERGSGSGRRKSLPLRERGLKSADRLQDIAEYLSLPLRERGLKF